MPHHIHCLTRSHSYYALPLAPLYPSTHTVLFPRRLPSPPPPPPLRQQTLVSFIFIYFCRRLGNHHRFPSSPRRNHPRITPPPRTGTNCGRREFTLRRSVKTARVTSVVVNTFAVARCTARAVGSEYKKKRGKNTRHSKRLKNRVVSSRLRAVFRTKNTVATASFSYRRQCCSLPTVSYCRKNANKPSRPGFLTVRFNPSERCFVE